VCESFRPTFTDIKKYAVFLLLGSISAYLSISFSKDWIHYQWFFNVIYAETTWIELLKNNIPFSEPLFFVTAKVLDELIGLANFVVITTVILFTLKMHFLTKLVDNVFAVTFMYVCLYLFLFEGTLLRVAYATAFIIPAMYYLQKEKLFLSILLFLIATQIQLTSIIFIIMYPLFLYGRLNWLVIALFIIAPMTILLDLSAFNLIVDLTKLFSNKYQFYSDEKIIDSQNSTGLFYYFIGFYYVLVIAIGCYLRQQIMSDSFKKMIFSLAMLGCVSMCFFYDHVAVGARLGELLLISMVILLGWLYIYFKEKQLPLHNYALIFIFMAYGLARFFYLYPTLVSQLKALV